MPTIDNFVLAKISKECPACSSLFSTVALVEIPLDTPETLIETDFHCNLSDSTVRESSLALCPFCHYCWWHRAFKQHGFQPEFLPLSTDISPTKKYAKAVQTGRKNNMNAIEIAEMAVNGYWSARECGENIEPWIKLAKKELEKALSGEIGTADRSYFTYLLGELYRLSGNFLGAMGQYKKVGEAASWIPKELIDKQKSLTIAGDSSITLLPPHLVKQLFCIESIEDILA